MYLFSRPFLTKQEIIQKRIGGEGGIRTLDTLLTYTPLAGERLQPLGHFTYSYQLASYWITKNTSLIALRYYNNLL